MKQIVVLMSLALVAVVAAEKITPSEQCQGANFDDLRGRIQVSPCGKTRCKLRKGTDIHVHFRFNPTSEVKQLSNSVWATIGGIPLPFPGVDGSSACEHVSNAADDSSAPCPLAPGKEYKYENSFHVEDFYPEVGMRVHWGLNDGKKDVICFEVPAVIVKA
ncbi:NPC intracellular cholesterol transporter 2-like [Aricia agestis]|uniref:NPC intracellular cholesterol transporter 2-like n=1 Tax=Aricia agestis TaxID=91739 RepID=UPI001C20791B|nr:NPC intracellular cholesterol transporter 2-like [Aricia agestis]